MNKFVMIVSTMLCLGSAIVYAQTACGDIATSGACTQGGSPDGNGGCTQLTATDGTCTGAATYGCVVYAPANCTGWPYVLTNGHCVADTSHGKTTINWIQKGLGTSACVKEADPAPPANPL